MAALGLVVATGTGCLLPSIDSAAYGGQDASQNPGNGGGSGEDDTQSADTGSQDTGGGLEDTGGGSGGEDTGNGGGDDTGGGGDDSGNGGGDASWKDVQTIMGNDCGGGGCHDGATKIGGFKFKADSSESEFKSSVKPVVTPGSPSESTLYTEVKNGDMPKGGEPLSDAEQTTIKNWISGLSSL